MKRVGFYYWAGPGTIRMIQHKYPGAKIDTESLLTSYDYSTLKQAKTRFGITDVWVTYSWGFSQVTEQQDYAFIESKLPYFKRLGLRTHAYIQGCNLVLREHQEKDYYCRDYRGRLIAYHRGRKVTCSNNPHFQNVLFGKVEQALKLPFDGIFIDNIHFGQFPLCVGTNWVTFFGCGCEYCRKKFKNEYAQEIPAFFNRHSKIFKNYLTFRKDSLMKLVRSVSHLVRTAHKEFGTNSFDPRHDTEFTYGTDLTELASFQDYLLFENHSLPNQSSGINNTYLSPIIKNLAKPVFVVSYRKGIGREPQYSQRDFDAIVTESTLLGYSPCFKASEYTTKGIWHNIFIHQFNRPQRLTNFSLPTCTQSPKRLVGTKLLRLYNLIYGPLVTALYEKRWVRRIGEPLYYYALR